MKICWKFVNVGNTKKTREKEDSEKKKKEKTETGKHNREIYIFPYAKEFFCLREKEKKKSRDSVNYCINLFNGL